MHSGFWDSIWYSPPLPLEAPLGDHTSPPLFAYTPPPLKDGPPLFDEGGGVSYVVHMSTAMWRPPMSLPLSAAIANLASSGVLYSTMPMPFDHPSGLAPLPKPPFALSTKIF